MVFRWPSTTCVLLFAFSQCLAWSTGNTSLLSTPEQSRQLRRHKFRKHRILSSTILSEISSRTVISTDGEVLPPYTTIYLFDQLIDHSNSSLGTFKQRYWHTREFYQPGGPIFITTPGESNAELDRGVHLTNVTLQGAFAQMNGGAAIVLEHRFFGQSNPFPQMNVQTLAVHNVAQAIEDLVYFAQNVVLPMPGGDTDAIRPHKVPWVLSGGSYSGALTSWTLNKKPDIFWAGYSTSGVVQPIADFWQYFEPIRLNMPKNCSADVQLVVQHVDNVVASGNGTAISQIEEYFGLSNASSVEDLLGFMSFAIFEWQKLHVSSSKNSLFYQFCDALEISGGHIATEAGWGLENALLGWATFMRQLGDPPPDDPDSRHSDMSWMWMICNEFGWVQRGSSDLTQPAISFRQFTLQDFERDCRQMFPGAFASDDLISRVAATSDTYLGWKTTADRLFVANGNRDPWLYATLSAPTQNLQSTDLRPIRLADGFHCSDWWIVEGQYSEAIHAVQQEAMQTMEKWIGSFSPRADPVDTTS